MELKYSHRNLELSLFILIGFFCFWLLFDTLNIFNELFIRRAQIDDSRLISYYLIPWSQGSFRLADLWSDIHPAPFASLLYIISYEYESLNFRLTRAAVCVAIVGQIIFFMWLIRKSSSFDKIQTAFLIFFVFAILLSGNSSTRYEWNSVGFMHIYLTLAIFMLVGLAYLKDDALKPKYISILFLIVFLNLLFFRSFAIFWFLSIWGVLALRFVCLKFRDRGMFAITSLIIVGALIIEKTLLHLIDAQLPTHGYAISSLLDTLQIWFNDTKNMFTYILTALASGIFNPKGLHNMGFAQHSIRLTMVLFGCIYLSFMLIACIRIRSEEYIAPLILMTFSLLTILAAMLLRIPNGASGYSSYWPRYVPLRDLGVIGLFWIFSLEIKRFHKRGIKLRMPANIIITLLLAFLSYNYHDQNWSRAKSLHESEKVNVHATIFIGNIIAEKPLISFQEVEQKWQETTGIKIPNYFKLRSRPSLNVKTSPDMKAINFLQEENLNVFSKEH